MRLRKQTFDLLRDGEGNDHPKEHYSKNTAEIFSHNIITRNTFKDQRVTVMVYQVILHEQRFGQPLQQ